MSGFDIAEVVEAIADKLTPDTIGANVHAFMPDAPDLPALGVFPSLGEMVSYYDTQDGFGSLNLELRGATANIFAEDGLRRLYGWMSKGAGQDTSIVNVLEANHTLDGLVHDVMVTGADVRSIGTENAPMFEVVIGLRVMLDLDV